MVQRNYGIQLAVERYFEPPLLRSHFLAEWKPRTHSF